jgi:hypothetical protein
VLVRNRLDETKIASAKERLTAIPILESHENGILHLQPIGIEDQKVQAGEG